MRGRASWLAIGTGALWVLGIVGCVAGGIIDPAAFQRLTTQMLEHLELVDAEAQPEQPDDDSGEDEDENEIGQEDGDEGEEGAGDSESRTEARSQDSTDRKSVV